MGRCFGRAGGKGPACPSFLQSIGYCIRAGTSLELGNRKADFGQDPPPPLSSHLPASPPSETELISQIDEDRPGGEKPRCVPYISNSCGSSWIGARLKGKIVGVRGRISGLSVSPGVVMVLSFPVAGQPCWIHPLLAWWVPAHE